MPAVLFFFQVHKSAQPQTTLLISFLYVDSLMILNILHCQDKFISSYICKKSFTVQCTSEEVPVIIVKPRIGEITIKWYPDFYLE